MTSHRVGVVIDVSRVAGGAGSETQVPKLLPDEKRGDTHQHNQDDHAARELVSAVLASLVFLSRFRRTYFFLVSRSRLFESHSSSSRGLLIRVVVVIFVVVFVFPRTSLSINSLKYTPKKAISTQMVYHVLAAMYCLQRARAKLMKIRQSFRAIRARTHRNRPTKRDRFVTKRVPPSFPIRLSSIVVLSPRRRPSSSSSSSRLNFPLPSRVGVVPTPISGLRFVTSHQVRWTERHEDAQRNE